MLKSLVRKFKRLFVNYGRIMGTFMKAAKKMENFKAELEEEAMEYRDMIAQLDLVITKTEAEIDRADKALTTLNKIVG